MWSDQKMKTWDQRRQAGGDQDTLLTHYDQKLREEQRIRVRGSRWEVKVLNDHHFIYWWWAYCNKQNRKNKINKKKPFMKSLKDRHNIYHTCVCSLRKSGSWNSPLKTWKNRELILEAVTLCKHRIYSRSTKGTAHSLHSSNFKFFFFSCFYFCTWSYFNL